MKLSYKLLELIAKFHPQFERPLHGRLEDLQRGAEGDGDFTGFSSDIQNDIIKCVDLVVQDEIDKEIAGSSFLSIQVDETADISGKEQLSLILRFDRKGEVVERFLTFLDVSSDRSALAISSVVKQLLRRYGVWRRTERQTNHAHQRSSISDVWPYFWGSTSSS